MSSVFGERKPNLIIIDEIDGAMGSEQNVGHFCIVMIRVSTHVSDFVLYRMPLVL